jgi:hypothetical protein
VIKFGTDNLVAFPRPEELRKMMQSMAAIDAILSPEWEYRYYSFNCCWGDGEMMGSMRNGSGDDLFVLFSSHGAYMKGFSHEQWQEIPVLQAYANVPSCFASAVAEPAFSSEQVTFCCWNEKGVDKWETALIPPIEADENGSSWMLSDIAGGPERYVEFASEYYEVDVDPSIVRAIYDHAPITQVMASALNAEIEYEALLSDLAEIGYSVER